jgi:integrase
MATANLTDLNDRLASARRTAAEKARRQEFAIDGGLRILVYGSGKASAAYRYRDGSKLKSLVLAPVGERLSRKELEAIEERHREARRDRARGNDPQQLRTKAREDARVAAEELKRAQKDKSFTVRVLSRTYLDYASGSKKSWREDARIFERYVLPTIGSMPVADVDLKTVRRVLAEIAHAPIQRDRVISCCKRCWNWHDPMGMNPWRGERIPVRAPRDRLLTTSEIRALRSRLDKSIGMGRDIIELALLTGVRREEASAARREEFDGAQWRIAPERMKGKRVHVVLLSRQTQALVERILRSHNSPWLFPSPKLDGAISHEFAYKWLKSDPGITYTLHDLRRTMASYLGEMLVPDVVIDRVLAHAKQGVIKHYNVAKLTEPARAAWQQWADHLDALVNDPIQS